MIPYDDDSHSSDLEVSEVKVTIRLAVLPVTQRTRGRPSQGQQKGHEYISKAFKFDFRNDPHLFWIVLLSSLGPKYEANFSPVFCVVPSFSWRISGP
jgi:hypothetical protein